MDICSTYPDLNRLIRGFMDTIDSLFAGYYDLMCEYSLQLALRRNCSCSTYLYERRDVLLGEILKVAVKTQEDPCDILARFMVKYHEYHTKENQ